jgi:hypothetical protein
MPKTPESVIEVLPLDTIVPYWRNPRDNSKAIAQVTESIKQYGYQALIVVDTKRTIIAGHTRYAALKFLGYTEVPVIVSNMSAKKAKEYRIIDNKSGEIAKWTADLTLELKEFSTPGILEAFFPDISLEPDFSKMNHQVDEGKMDKAQDDLSKMFNGPERGDKAEPMVDVPCGNCGEVSRVAVRDIMMLGNWSE